VVVEDIGEAYCSGSGDTEARQISGQEQAGSFPRNISGRSCREGRTNPQAPLRVSKKGDKGALKIIEEVSRLNAIGFANVDTFYDPELITIGGSIALNNPELVLKPIAANMGGTR